MAVHRHRTVRYSPARKSGAGRLSFAKFVSIIKARAKSFSLLAAAFCFFGALAFFGDFNEFFPWAHLYVAFALFALSVLIFQNAKTKIRKPAMNLEQTLAAIRKLSVRNIIDPIVADEPAHYKNITAPLVENTNLPPALQIELPIEASSAPTESVAEINKLFDYEERKSLTERFCSLKSFLRSLFSKLYLSTKAIPHHLFVFTKKLLPFNWLINQYYEIRRFVVINISRVSMPRPRLIWNYSAVVVIVCAIIVLVSWESRTTKVIITETKLIPLQETVVQSAIIIPPEYTKLKPILLSGEGEKKLFSGDAKQVPEGSEFSLQVSGEGIAPVLEINGEETPLVPDEKGGFTVVHKINGGRSILLRKGWENLAAWRIQVVKDSSPIIKFTDSPKIAERKTVKLSYEVSDDYGVQTVIARITPLMASSESVDNPLDITLSASGTKKAKQIDFEDITSSPWAGMPVEIELIAKDAAGNISTTEATKFILPEREFIHPLARVLTEERKKLMRRPDESVCNEAANTMASIARQTASYRKDPVVTMSLRAGAVRLVLDKEKESLDAISELLWQAAVRIEDGTVGAAQNMLRMSQRDLLSAIDREASGNDINRLMDRAKIAIYRYLSELSAVGQNNINDVKTDLFLAADSKLISADDIIAILENARGLAEAGDRAAARQNLAQLQSLSEILRPIPQGGTPEQKQLLRQLTFLRSLLKAQKLLSEKTLVTETEEVKGIPTIIARELSGKQSDLLFELNEHEPEYYGFMDSSAAMQEVIHALLQGDKQTALQKQKDTEEALLRSAQDLAEQIRASIIEAQTAGADEVGKSGAALDRSSGIVINDGELESSDQMSLDRAKEIIDELQNRKTPDQKPKAKTERDYIDKLLQNF